MVDIFGGWGRIRTWIDKRIRIKDTGNLYLGEDSGNGTTGNYNNFVGYQAGYSNTSGYSNNFMGYQAGYSNIGGHYNDFLGDLAGYSNISGYSNTFLGSLTGYANSSGYSNSFVGFKAGYANFSGHSNIFIGYKAGYANTIGISNTFLGYKAGYSNVDGNGNVLLGYQAGYYETGSSKLFIDILHRANEADGRIKSLIYGMFAAATADQLLRLNGILELTEIKNGSTQANAGATANEVWKTNGHATLPDNVLMIGV